MAPIILGGVHVREHLRDTLVGDPSGGDQLRASQRRPLQRRLGAGQSHGPIRDARRRQARLVAPSFSVTLEACGDADDGETGGGLGELLVDARARGAVRKPDRDDDFGGLDFRRTGT